MGVEDDKGPMVGQHLEGARIKLLRTDLVRGSVCAGIASREQTRGSFVLVLSFTLSLSRKRKKKKRIHNHVTVTPHYGERIDEGIRGIESSRATKNRSCIFNAIET